MRAGPAIRRLLLLTHISTSVGLVGAVTGFLVLAMAGLSGSTVGQTVYPAMDLITQYVIVPLALVTLALGVLQSLITPWGLIRHYWVLIKLVLTIFVVVVLWLQLGNIRLLAGLPPGAFLGSEWVTTKFSMVLHSGGGLVVLLGATVLSVYKPAGLTRYGWNRRYGHAVASDLSGPDREGPESA
ncbi:MAG: hypothetical protein BGO83_18195 [Devosia sp. 66-14]|nr:hypothetical protein [Devosia sp.]ODS87940.1 MAG: hypothetical protein ABS47_11215 [Devosia sp. SCN 66-27]OJX22715.1 MAG: hypothetical protein BGO83_18195 [Devosia sp. 66-14]